MECTVELFGTLRQLMGASEVELKLPSDSSLKDVLSALVQREARLLEGVVDLDMQALSKPYRFYQEGKGFADDLSQKVEHGARLLLMSAAVGG
jgi:molybdopterin converting factor small subunit